MLVLVLWVLVVLALLALTLAQNTRLDNAVRGTMQDRVQARWLARAGVQRALSEIAQDAGATDGIHDRWYDSPEIFRNVELDQGTYCVSADRFSSDQSTAYGVCDEASKLNLNAATPEMLVRLTGMTEELVQPLLNWRQDRSPPAGDSRALASVSPAQRRTAYVRVFTTIRSLGLVPSMRPEHLFGEDANLNGLLDDNENDGDLSYPPDDQNGVLKRGLLSYVTVYSFDRNEDGMGRPRININTADQQQLETELGLEEGHVLWILERQGQFAGVADLLDVNTLIQEETVGSVRASRLHSSDPLDKPKPVSIPLDLKTFRRIADRITVMDDEIIPGRINVNTAGREVLCALPGMTGALADRLIDRRRELPDGYTSIAEVLFVPQMTLPIFKRIAPWITVRSNVFTVHSTGRAARSGLAHHIEAVAVRQRAQVSIVYWNERR
ncbi:MAG: general secretion pathway protein GspK [Sedimentisphaerales bacterium]|nr:general secretion pathway protein GspK [Sedimentisphaerales bacterium]